MNLVNAGQITAGGISAPFTLLPPGPGGTEGPPGGGSAGGLSEYDLLELVVFGTKVESEGLRYAARHCGPRLESQGLKPLPLQATRELWLQHAAAVETWWAQHPDDGADLHNAHIDAASQRRDAQCLWARPVR